MNGGNSMELKLYNTLSRQKEVFKPIDDKAVRIYTCGPTVYYYAHIGNLRCYLFMDNLRRVLKYNDYELQHAMNITDVGHLVSDADEGEDKMMKAARRENKDPYEIAEFYMNRFLEDLEKLNVSRPEIICRATEHIKDMEEYVQKIIENGYAYETKDTIYFDTSKLDKYGVLSNIKIDEQKGNVTDFALWIKAPENHIMKWDTFWGKCYPGWHIECSAMSRKYLGNFLIYILVELITFQFIMKMRLLKVKVIQAIFLLIGGCIVNFYLLMAERCQRV